jgi:pullulanase/glycogen debranching enzyme
VLEKRRRLQRALLATLLIAQGVPMLQGGDELGRTQGGNNNAYCQDNEMTWLDWQKADSELIDYVAGLIGLRRRFPQLRLTGWLSGAASGDEQPDVLWWHPAGRPMGISLTGSRTSSAPSACNWLPRRCAARRQRAARPCSA